MSSGSPSSHDCKAGRGEQVVERHRQLEAILRRKERFEIHARRPCDRRRLDLLDQRGEVQIASRAATRCRAWSRCRMCSRLFTGSASMPDAGRAGSSPSSSMRSRSSFAVVAHRRGRRRERLQDRYRDACLAARRVDREIGGVTKAPMRAPSSPQSASPFATAPPAAAANVGGREPFVALVLVDPRLEVLPA